VPWSHPLIYTLFVTSVLTAILYILYEEFWAKEPILTPRLLASRNVLVPNIVLFCQAAAQLGVSNLQHIILGAWLISADDVHSSHVLSDNSTRVDNSGGRTLAPSSWGCYGRWTARWVSNQRVSLYRSGAWLIDSRLTRYVVSSVIKCCWRLPPCALLLVTCYLSSDGACISSPGNHHILYWGEWNPCFSFLNLQVSSGLTNASVA
jgi:hypothetical protein